MATTTKTTRPDYITNLVNSLSNDIRSTNIGDYTNLQYSGMDDNSYKALQSMLNNPEYRNYAEQLMNAGTEGLDTLNSTFDQVSEAYNNGEITADQLDTLASRLYNRGDVENQITQLNRQAERQYSTDVAPNAAQQVNVNAGFGSMNRLASRRGEEALTQQMQANSENTSNQAYQTALDQAQNILTSNQATRRAALGTLSQNAATQAGYMSKGAQMNDYLNQQGFNAVQQMQDDRQNQLNNEYQNSINRQQWQKQQTNNLINSAAVLNGALGMTTTQSTSGGSSFLSGAMAGAGAGAAFG
ncbi:hypothetical protein ABDC18_002872 [Escherichia coli]